MVVVLGIYAGLIDGGETQSCFIPVPLFSFFLEEYPNETVFHGDEEKAADNMEKHLNLVSTELKRLISNKKWI